MTKTTTPEETIRIGEELGKELTPNTVIALHGDLGAGKTTLVKGIARGLNVEEEITSPTFVIISEYPGRLPLFHMDLYRISGIDEFLDLGAEELFYSGGITVIEWSDRIRSILPSDCIRITITFDSDPAKRIISGEGMEL
ncbi:MAG: tRNA (adenosine(37)-N6)-threonylcarbamoyltransferase complex ATPase subunit type 1 TsaE [Spirochaetia bacterium]